MDKAYKPAGYNSVSPYFIVDGAQKLIDFLVQLFDGKELRKYKREDGSIMHAEVKIDDSVVMISDATDEYPPVTIIMHVYVPDVNTCYIKALKLGASELQKPKNNEGDPDNRGTFLDFAGNMWSVSTQI
ncbi:MAG: VOC family protein [Flavitalea sp.]